VRKQVLRVLRAVMSDFLNHFFVTGKLDLSA